MKTNCRHYRILLSLFLSTIFIGCAKNDPVVLDSADKYVGHYTYRIVITGGLKQTIEGEFSITKTGVNKIASTIKGEPTIYTVDGNSISEDSGQYIELRFISETISTPTASFAENSIGTLDGNSLIINGTWRHAAFQICYFYIYATKQ